MQHERHALDLVAALELFGRRRERDPRRTIEREAEDPRRDRGEGDRPAVELRRGGQGGAVARREQLVLTLAPAAPDGPNGVDDVPRRQTAGVRRLRLAGVATAEQATFLQDGRPAGAVNCSVDAAAAEERAVRRVDDRVDALLRDVAFDELDPHSALGRDSTQRGPTVRSRYRVRTWHRCARPRAILLHVVETALAVPGTYRVQGSQFRTWLREPERQQ